MPSKIAWLIENHVLLVTFEGIITQEEFEEFVVQTLIFLKKADYPVVHQIIDATKISTLPDNNILLCASSIKQAGIGWSVIISNGNTVLRTRVNAINRQMNIRYRYVITMEDATRLLKKLDTSLEELTFRHPSDSTDD
ncbi:MAG: hypothetical protein ACPG7F_13015 [Aggregatilineales bacterium]